MTTLKDEAIKLLDQWEAIARDKNRYIAALEAKIDRQNAEIAELRELVGTHKPLTFEQVALGAIDPALKP